VRRRIRRSAVLPDVLEGRINPGRVSDYTTDHVRIGDATPPRTNARAIKALLRIGL
jgi:hypothetical protein